MPYVLTRITVKDYDEYMRVFQDNAALRQSNGPRSVRLFHSTDDPPEGRLELFNELGLIFGASYESTAAVPDGTVLPEVANPVTDYIPTARPGSRAPHVWLERAGQSVSTLDLFGKGFVLLVAQGGRAWCQAAVEVAQMQGIPLQAFTVGRTGDLIDPDGSWAPTYGLDQDGAVLVRPDGYVAWRTRSRVTSPVQALQEVFARVLGEMAAWEERRDASNAKSV